MNPSAARSRSTAPRRQNEMADAVAPNTACPLLVASATCGGNPAASSAGRLTSPPPPPIASTSPAPKAAATSAAITAPEPEPEPEQGKLSDTAIRIYPTATRSLNCQGKGRRKRGAGDKRR